jgi:epsilon-lactone hydrolase
VKCSHDRLPTTKQLPSHIHSLSLVFHKQYRRDQIKLVDMATDSSNLIDVNYNFIKQQLAVIDPTDIVSQRLVLETLHSSASEPLGVTYEEVRCPGTIKPAIWCKPLGASPKHAILYTHGGAGFSGSPQSHRKIAGHIAKASACPALVIDYRLVPEHPFPAGLLDVLAAYKWLLETVPANSIAIVGDSMGGNLAVSVVLKAREAGLALPSAIAAISPWIDMEQSGESIKTNVHCDLLAAPGTFAQISKLYLGNTSPQNPFANPLYGDYHGFPPMFLTSGGAEMLADNATRLGDKARAAGVHVEVEVVPDMQHVFPFMAGNSKIADQTVQKIGHFIKTNLKLL